MTNSKKNSPFSGEGYARWKRSIHGVGEFKNIPSGPQLEDEEHDEIGLESSIFLEVDGDYFGQSKLGEDVLSLKLTIYDQEIILSDEELDGFLEKSKHTKGIETFNLNVSNGEITLNRKELDMLKRVYEHLINP